LCESATTIRKVGCFLRPVRRRRSFTIVLSSLGFLHYSGLLAHSSTDGPHPSCHPMAASAAVGSTFTNPNLGLRPIQLDPTRFARWMTTLPHSKHIRAELSSPLPRCSLFHHFLHLPELLQQPVHFRDRPAGSLRDPRPARAVHDLRLLPLVERHREHD